MTDLNPKVVVVDDDEAILDSLKQYLELRGCTVATAQSGAELDAQLASEPCDVIVLDLMIPGEDGLAICRRLPDSQPIIMLSAIGDVTDRIVGLEMGAWDYLAKPFDPRELLARIRSMVRRPTASPDEGIRRDAYQFDDWVLDVSEQILVSPQGQTVGLSSAEFHLLQAFVKSPGRLLTRDYLLTATHDEHTNIFDRAIDVTVSRLRKKLDDPNGPSMIETVRGTGYRFLPNAKPL